MAVALLSGCVMYLMWEWCAGKKNAETGVLYYTLKALIAVYLFPFVLVMPDVWRRTTAGYLRTGWTLKVMEVLALVWLAGAVLTCCYYLYHIIGYHRADRELIECGVHVQRLAEQTAARMGIRRRVRVMEGYAVTAPELSGWFRPVIRVPAGDYEEEELRYIFTHELAHVKNGDTAMRELMLLVSCVYWMSPVCRKLVRRLDTWSELYCDERVCSYGFIERKRYAEILYRMMERAEERRSFLRPGLCEDCFELERRIHRMEESRGRKKRGVLGTAGIALVFFLAQSGSALAAWQGVDLLYGRAVMETMVSIQEELEEVVREELEEHTTLLDEEMLEKIRESADGARLKAGLNTIEVTLQNDLYCSEGFEAEAGGEVTVSIFLKPTDIKVKVGIIQPDNSYKWVEGSDIIEHSFQIVWTGVHQVMIWNETDREVLVVGVVEVY